MKTYTQEQVDDLIARIKAYQSSCVEEGVTQKLCQMNSRAGLEKHIDAVYEEWQDLD